MTDHESKCALWVLCPMSNILDRCGEELRSLRVFEGMVKLALGTHGENAGEAIQKIREAVKELDMSIESRKELCRMLYESSAPL